jgi:tight adherence protein B
MIPIDRLATGPGPTVLAVLVGLLVATIAAAALTRYGLEPGSSRRLRRRIDRARLAAGAARATRGPVTAGSVRRQPAKTILGRVGQDMIRVLPRAQAMRRRLDQAGVRLNVLDYALLCGLGGVLVGLLIHLLYAPPLAIVLGLATITASGVPHFLLAQRIKRRRRQFLTQFPDAIDLIVRGVRSGIPVAEALQAAGQELPNHVGTLFQEVTGNIRLGKSLDESLTLAAATLEIQELRFFIISLSIQQETGGNLGEILQNLSTLMRRREQMKMKIKAMSSEARASAMIIGSLPFIMFMVIYLIDPGYVMKLFIDPRGWLLLGGGLSSLAMGVGIMSKMVRFEI